MKPNQLSGHTLLAPEQFYVKRLNAVGSQALTVQDRRQPVSGEFVGRSRYLHDSQSHV